MTSFFNLILKPSINLVRLRPQLFNHSHLASFLSYRPHNLPLISNQGEAWISIAHTLELLISIREHLSSMLRHKLSTPAGLYSSLFDNAWNRVRSYSESMSGGFGVGTHEARHWHRRAYGGIVSFASCHRLYIGQTYSLGRTQSHAA